MYTTRKILKLLPSHKEIYVLVWNGLIYIEFVPAPGNKRLPVVEGMKYDEVIQILARTLSTNVPALETFY